MRRTRNPVYGYTVPWVRIPPFPPGIKKKARKSVTYGLCLFPVVHLAHHGDHSAQSAQFDHSFMRGVVEEQASFVQIGRCDLIRRTCPVLVMRPHDAGENVDEPQGQTILAFPRCPPRGLLPGVPRGLPPGRGVQNGIANRRELRREIVVQSIPVFNLQSVSNFQESHASIY